MNTRYDPIGDVERVLYASAQPGAQVADMMRQMDEALNRMSAWLASPEVRAEEQRIAVHNTRVRAQRARKALARQRVINAREVAAVRSAACPRCLATHAGEC
jgi:hypothetical protein